MEENDIFIHMGHSNFDLDLFQNIVNDRGWVKPRGGLWASPLNANFGWKDWTAVNDFMQDKYLGSSFKFKLSKNARVLYVDSSEKLIDLPKRENDVFSIKEFNWVALDFQKLAQEYDAMLVLISNDHKLYWDLYGWDCDTLLVFNPNIVEIIE